jgi:hypothetical protein
LKVYVFRAIFSNVYFKSSIFLLRKSSSFSLGNILSLLLDCWMFFTVSSFCYKRDSLLDAWPSACCKFALAFSRSLLGLSGSVFEKAIESAFSTVSEILMFWFICFTYSICVVFSRKSDSLFFIRS